MFLHIYIYIERKRIVFVLHYALSGNAGKQQYVLINEQAGGAGLASYALYCG